MPLPLSNVDCFSVACEMLGTLPTQPAKYFAPNNQEERVAKLDDIEHLIRPGDFMWFAGKKPHSMLIRVYMCSTVSHGGNYDRGWRNADGSFTRDVNGHVWVRDVCEGHGCRCITLREELETVKRSYKCFQGTYYWAPIDRYRFYDYDGESAMDAAEAYLGKPYGKTAVLYETLFHLPIIRGLAYWRWHGKLNQAWGDCAPYCSMAQKLWSIKGGTDCVPGRVPQLTSPQDTWQTLLAPIKIAVTL